MPTVFHAGTNDGFVDVTQARKKPSGSIQESAFLAVDATINSM